MPWWSIGGLCAFTAGAFTAGVLVRELRSHRSHSVAKQREKKNQ